MAQALNRSLNKVILIGDVFKTPEISSISMDDRVAKFSLSTTKVWIDKNTQERKEKVEFHRVVCYNRQLISVIEIMVKTGSHVYVEGEIETTSYTDKKGIERYLTNIVIQKFSGNLIVLDDKKWEER